VSGVGGGVILGEGFGVFHRPPAVQRGCVIIYDLIERLPSVARRKFVGDCGCGCQRDRPRSTLVFTGEYVYHFILFGCRIVKYEKRLDNFFQHQCFLTNSMVLLSQGERRA